MGEFRKCPVPQATGHSKLFAHYKTCSKASEEVKGRVRNQSENRQSGPHISETNCPLCGIILRADRIVPHIASNHSPLLLMKYMPQLEREQSLSYKIPVIKCYKDGKMVFRFCIHCKKGCLATARTKVCADASIGIIKRNENHKSCCEEFEAYKYLFEIKDAHEDLPFHLHNCDNPDKPIRKTYTADATDAYVARNEKADTDSEAEETEEEEPKNTVIYSEEIEGYKTKVQMAEGLVKVRDIQLKARDTEIDALKEKLKEGQTADPDLLEIVPLLRTIADDKYEEFDYEDLKNALVKYIRQNADLETSLRIEYQKAMARKDMIIAKLKEDIEDKDAYIDTFGTVSFGRGGKRIDPDSD